MAGHLRLLREVEGAGPAEYIWAGPDGVLCSKARTVGISSNEHGEAVPILERWSATLDDGTQVLLVPCHYMPHPLRAKPAFIVLCEVRDLKDAVVPYNHRARLRGAMPNPHFWWGVRQQFRLDAAKPRQAQTAAKRHLKICLEAGLMLHSGRHGHDDPWEFKLGPRRLPDKYDPDAPTAEVIADHLQIARFLLDRIALEAGLKVSYADTLTSVFFSTPDTRGLRIEMDAVAKEVQRRLGIPEFLIVPRIGVAERGYTMLEVKGFPGNIDPHLLLSQVIHPIHKGKRLTAEHLEASIENPPDNVP